MFDHPKSATFSFQSTSVAYQQLSNFSTIIITIIAIFLKDQRYFIDQISNVSAPLSNRR